MLLDAAQPIMLAEQTIADPNHFIDACAVGLHLYRFTLFLLVSASANPIRANQGPPRSDDRCCGGTVATGIPRLGLLPACWFLHDEGDWAPDSRCIEAFLV